MKGITTFQAILGALFVFACFGIFIAYVYFAKVLIFDLNRPIIGGIMLFGPIGAGIFSAVVAGIKHDMDY